MPNQSQVNDPRFWTKWIKAGAVAAPFEMKKKIVNGYLADAKKWLGYARSLYGENEDRISYIRKYLAKAGASLEDIGSSEAEVAQLLIDGYLADAKKWLGYARSLYGENEDRISYVRKYLAKAGASLEDIGSSEAEIATILA